MKRLVEFSLEDRGTVVFEVGDAAPAPGPVRAGRADEVIEKAQLSFEQAVACYAPDRRRPPRSASRVADAA